MEVRERQLKLIEMLGERIDKEHALISSRMTWLMAMNGFLFTAFAILVINSRSFQSANVLATLTGTVGAVGVVSNASAFYSHYWASRAIREADLATRWGLERVREDEINPPEALFRLAGRDPKLSYKDKDSEVKYPERSAITHPVWPPQRLLHPWYLLPLAACAAFIAMPLAVGSLQTAGTDDASDWLSALPLLALSPVVAVFASERVGEIRTRRAERYERSRADAS